MKGRAIRGGFHRHLIQADVGPPGRERADNADDGPGVRRREDQAELAPLPARTRGGEGEGTGGVAAAGRDGDRPSIIENPLLGPKLEGETILLSNDGRDGLADPAVWR